MERELMATLSLVTTAVMFGAKFAKVAELYARWEYAAKQQKKVAALEILRMKVDLAGTMLECDAADVVSTRQAVADVSELVDGARVWHYKRGEGVLFWRFEVGREAKQYHTVDWQ